tara:strand:+ start:240 stop:515 length:276 start_codon:yes stop_codon:yes gene_type:complete
MQGKSEEIKVIKRLSKDEFNSQQDVEREKYRKELQGKPRGRVMDLLIDLWDFMRIRKKFWLAPIFIVLLLLSLLLVVAENTVVAPFIYQIF